MSQITTVIPEFTAAIPNKDTQTPSEFDIAVDELLQWWLRLPVPINNFATEANAVKEEVNILRNETETLKIDAETMKNEAEAARDKANKWATEAEDVLVDDGINPTGYSAKHYQEKARKWAESDIEVEVGKYSAKYWSSKAQEWAESDIEVEVGKYSAKYWAQQALTGNSSCATSNTQQEIGLGNKTFVINENNKFFVAGMRVWMVPSAEPGLCMEGVVSAFDGSNLTVDVSFIDGSGIFNDWGIFLSLEAPKVVFEQTSPSLVWVINHNLNSETPSVVVVNDLFFCGAGSYCGMLDSYCGSSVKKINKDCDIIIKDNNKLNIFFNKPKVGLVKITR